MPHRASLAVFVAFALCASLAIAQGAGAAFQDTFTATAPNGEAIVTPSETKRVTGTLTGPGTAIDPVGDLDPSDGAVRGRATAAGETARFEATLLGDLLTVILIEVDADVRPNLSTAIALDLHRQKSYSFAVTTDGRVHLHPHRMTGRPALPDPECARTMLRELRPIPGLAITDDRIDGFELRPISEPSGCGRKLAAASRRRDSDSSTLAPACRRYSTSSRMWRT